MSSPLDCSDSDASSFDCFEPIEGSPLLFKIDVSALGPGKGFRVGIVAIEIVVDGILEFGHARECAASNALLRDLREEALDRRWLRRLSSADPSLGTA